MHMSETPEVESLLNLVCSEVFNAIKSDLELAKRHAIEFEELRGIKWILNPLGANKVEFFRFLIKAAALSDLLSNVSQILQSSKEVSDNVDFDFAARLLSESMHRFEWIEDYQQFQKLSNSSDLLCLLLWWSKDEDPFGGDYDSGALFRPFQTLCILSCSITRDTMIFDAYATAIKLFTRSILQTNSYNPSKQSFYTSVCQMLGSYEASLQNRIKLIDIAMEIEKYEDDAQS